MVGADMERVGSLRLVAQELADSSGQEIKVLKFSQRTEVEIIKPEEVA